MTSSTPLSLSQWRSRMSHPVFRRLSGPRFGFSTKGWDRYRGETYQRQLRLGVIPADTKLTPRPAEIPAWESLSADQKRIAARLMETFAAFTVRTDFHVGRVLD